MPASYLARFGLLASWRQLVPTTLELAHVDMHIVGKRIALSPGRNITAEIKTGKRREIEFLLSPVQRAGRESLLER